LRRFGSLLWYLVNVGKGMGGGLGRLSVGVSVQELVEPGLKPGL